MEETRVYLNSWYFYNEGHIGFGWMTTDEARNFMAEHEEDTRYEEWFIADVDNYCGIDTDGLEYRNIEEFLDEIDELEAMDEDERKIVEAMREYKGGRCSDSPSDLLREAENYIVYMDSAGFEDFLDEEIEMYLDNVPSIVRDCFDYSRYYELCKMDAYEAENGVIIL